MRRYQQNHRIDLVFCGRCCWCKSTCCKRALGSIFSLLTMSSPPTQSVLVWRSTFWHIFPRGHWMEHCLAHISRISIIGIWIYMVTWTALLGAGLETFASFGIMNLVMFHCVSELFPLFPFKLLHHQCCKNCNLYSRIHSTSACPTSVHTATENLG